MRRRVVITGMGAVTPLGHSVRDKTEAAYRRATYLEERRGLMARWAMYVEGDNSIVLASAGSAPYGRPDAGVDLGGQASGQNGDDSGVSAAAARRLDSDPRRRLQSRKGRSPGRRIDTQIVGQFPINRWMVMDMKDAVALLIR